MIYFDSSATTMQKPIEVGEAIKTAVNSFGNPGRSFHDPSMLAGRTVYGTRYNIAKLAQIENPFNIAFTSGATESVNLVIRSLINSCDHVITSILEHNCILRPLYNRGCELSFIPCDQNGRLILDNLNSYLKPNTRFLVCTHGSNLTGAITNTEILYKFSKDNGLIFILDAAQTLGTIKTHGDMADIICFTGHKGLMGPQGTGGIIVNKKMDFKVVKTGGSGSNSFLKHQSLEMPEIFEPGTPNAHGLAGLSKGVEHINSLGIEAVIEHESKLTKRFLNGVREIPNIRIYGGNIEDKPPLLPVIALNIKDMPAEEVSLKLWEDYKIITRSGNHCAPLVHSYFGTEKQGMVRFSFGLYNTNHEVDVAISALNTLARG